ncbi:UNVERIFIED_CONTAM: hypothetical protein FKN15_012749 [Acipenser sinensis]
MNQRNKQQEDIVRLKAKKKSLEMELEAVGDKHKQISGRLRDVQNKKVVQKSELDLIDQKRDRRIMEINNLQQQLENYQKKLTQLVPEQQMLTERLKNTNLNNVQTTPLTTLMRSRSEKDGSCRMLKEQLDALEKKTSSKLSEMEVFNKELKCEDMDDSVLQCLLSLLGCLSNLFLLIKNKKVVQKSELDLIDQKRDRRIMEINNLQQQLENYQKKLTQLVPEQQMLTERLKNTNLNNVQTTPLTTLMRSRSEKDGSCRMLKEQLDALEKKTSSKLSEMEVFNKELKELRQSQNKQQRAIEQLYKIKEEKLREIERRKEQEHSQKRKAEEEAIRKAKQEKDNLWREKVRREEEERQKRMQEERSQKMQQEEELEAEARLRETQEGAMREQREAEEMQRKEEEERQRQAQARREKEEEQRRQAQPRREAEEEKRRQEQLRKEAGERQRKKQEDEVAKEAMGQRRQQQQNSENFTNIKIDLQEKISSMVKGFDEKDSKTRAFTYFISMNDDLNQCNIFEVDETTIGGEPGWLYGSFQGHTGWFPANYVEKIAEKKVPSASKTALLPPTVSKSSTSHSSGMCRQPTAFFHTADPPCSHPRATASEDNAALGQLTGKPAGARPDYRGRWCTARGKKRQKGWFPGSHVKHLGAGSDKTTPAPMPAPTPVCQVIAKYDYAAMNEDELSFSKGQLISVLNKDDSDWWKGELNGAAGLFPSNYVQMTTESDPSQQWCADLTSLDTMSPIERKRQGYIHELIETEERYMDDLQLVVEVFQKPLTESEKLTESEMGMIFVNWKELIMSNFELLKALRERKKMGGEKMPVQMIGDILAAELSHMQAYIRFCSYQLNGAATLQEKTDEQPEFKDILKRLATDPGCKGMPFSSFLLKPMQRITRYPLIIKNILENTSETHPDYTHLKQALERAEELCSQVNEGVRKKENSDRLEWIQTHIQCDELTEQLIFNSLTNCLGPRKLLHSGKLYKTKSNKELYGFLFNDFLLLTYTNKQLTSFGSDKLFSPKSNSHFKIYKTANRFYVSTSLLRTAWVQKIKAASEHFIQAEKKQREKAYQARSLKTTGIGRLLVNIIEATELKSCKPNGRSSPYCEITMGYQCFTTRTLTDTLNPKWNFNCQFFVKDIYQDVLCITVYEKEQFSPDGKSNPYCEITMGYQCFTTRTLTDTLNPKWNFNCQFFVKNIYQDVLCITVYERDQFSPDDFLGRTEVPVATIKKEQETKGPTTKRLLLHEVPTGEVWARLDLQLYEQKTLL